MKEEVEGITRTIDREEIDRGGERREGVLREKRQGKERGERARLRGRGRGRGREWCGGVIEGIQIRYMYTRMHIHTLTCTQILSHTLTYLCAYAHNCC
jgi:hypothetical protein